MRKLVFFGGLLMVILFVGVALVGAQGDNSIVCYSNDDCPSAAGEPYCQDGNTKCGTVSAFTCSNPGTTDSECVASGGGLGCSVCPNGCVEGECVEEEEIECYNDEDCGYVTGEPYCFNGEECHSVTTFACNNPGTPDANCYTSEAGIECVYCDYGCVEGECDEEDVDEIISKCEGKECFLIEGQFVELDINREGYFRVIIDKLDSKEVILDLNGQKTEPLGEDEWFIIEMLGIKLWVRELNVGDAAGAVNSVLFTYAERGNEDECADVECEPGYKCKEGICKEVDLPKEVVGYRNAYWRCLDTREVNSGSDSSCKPSKVWKKYAKEYCRDDCDTSGPGNFCKVSEFSVSIECVYDVDHSDKNKEKDIEILNEDDSGDDEIDLTCTNACPFDGKCYPFGYRIESEFCTDEGIFVNQKGEDLTCTNSFECESNLCIDGKCVDRGLFTKIVDWLKGLFGG